jgi:Domain of unknown function (DUF4126)
MEHAVTSFVSIALGVGLAAATGFRIFLPLLIAGLAARAGWLPLNEGFLWLQSTAALATLGSAAVFETLAYYIPGVDHLLDVIAGPAAVVAGVIASASVMTNISPGIMWPLAIIAGGSVAGLTKTGSALIRAKTGVATAGLGNPVVSTAETAGATLLSILAILVPLICALLVVALLYWSLRRIARFFQSRSKQRAG